MMDEQERLLIQRIIGSIIDHPSVYMGGPSREALRKADNIIKALECGKRLVPTSCAHEGWKDFKSHGAYCPDCSSLLPEKMQPARHDNAAQKDSKGAEEGGQG